MYKYIFIWINAMLNTISDADKKMSIVLLQPLLKMF